MREAHGLGLHVTLIAQRRSRTPLLWSIIGSNRVLDYQAASENCLAPTPAGLGYGLDGLPTNRTKRLTNV